MEQPQVERWQQRLARLESTRERAEANAADEERRLASVQQRQEDASMALRITQAVAEACQRSAHAQIAGVVNRCLEAVFGDDAPGFRIDFAKARNKTEARLTFTANGHDLDPEDVGGGIIDVASFALRLAALLLMRPRKRLFLALDEPMKHLSRAYRPAVRELLLALADELGVQFLLITHASELAIGDVVELE